jgi:hypothetical protein
VCDVEIRLELRRLETDEEYEQRIAKEKEVARRKILYQKLKQEFEGGN